MQALKLEGSQVVAVNHFRNTMNNNKAAEYMRNCGANSCLMVERYIKDGNSKNDGVTITNMGDTQNLAGTTTTLDDGSYTDQVSGGKITVSGGKITSGSAPAGKISVFFTDNSASVSASGSKSFKTNTTTVTLNASNATNTTYTTSEGKSGSYKDGDTITVGASTAVGGTVTVKVQGKDADGQTVSGEFTCTKNIRTLPARLMQRSQTRGATCMHTCMWTILTPPPCRRTPSGRANR